MIDTGSPSLEIVNPHRLRGPFRCAVFDFDGTLSLIRANWQGLMVPMMIEALLATRSGESADELRAIVEELVTRLTGQPTIVQMQALADEIKQRGGQPREVREYLAQYFDMLRAQSSVRIEALETGRAKPDEMLVPGARGLVEALARQRMLLVIASGTEQAEVRLETELLGLAPFFGPRIFGPVDGDPRFSKEAVLRMLIEEHGLAPEEIVAIGDGPTEILAVKAVGGLAIGVASDEIDRDGRVNRLKREHLLRAGADVIIADYRVLPEVLRLLTPDP
jgi:phosphoglycolate phosphatase-like HAD superfamily hydrolase